MYVDDTLNIPFYPKAILKYIQHMVIFNNFNIEVLVGYLVALLKLKTLNGIHCWTTTSFYYTNATIYNVKEVIITEVWKLPARYNTPIKLMHALELDGTPELDTNDH